MKTLTGRLASPAFFLALSATSAGATGLADALTHARADLSVAERYCAEVVARVDAERAALLSEVDSLEARRTDLEGVVALLETRKKAGIEKQHDLDQSLSAAEDEYRELSGSIRRAVGDVGALIHRSPLTGTAPARVDRLAPLLDRNRLPDPTDVASLANLVFDELQGSSKVRRARATIVARDGTEREADVLTIGKFNPMYRDGKDVGFLAYTHQTRKLIARAAEPPRSVRGAMNRYFAGRSGRTPVDISTGGAKRVSRELTMPERFVALLPMLWPYALVAIGMVVIGYRTHRRATGALLERTRHSLREVFPIAVSLVMNFSLVAVAVVKGGAEKKPELVEVALVGVDAPQPPPPPEELVEPEPSPDLSPSDLTSDLASAPAPAFTAADFGEPDFSGPDASGMGGLGLPAGDLAYGLGGAAAGPGGGGSGGGRQAMIFESFQLDQAPRPVVKTPPTYPFKAREQGTEGVVQVKILVREDGGVGEVLVLDSRPKDVFDDAVLAAVPQWRFEPGVIDGKKVTSWVVTALRFELN